MIRRDAQSFIVVFTFILFTSFLGSINLLAVPLGCFLSGVLTEPLGKRRAMQVIQSSRARRLIPLR